MMLDPRIGKDIENRPWNTHYRGPFLFHAARILDLASSRAAFQFLRHMRERDQVSITAAEIFNMERDVAKLSFGGIVGGGWLTDVIEPEKHSGAHPWHMREFNRRPQYGLRLESRLRLPFRPYRGSQRWFNVKLTDEEKTLIEAWTSRLLGGKA